ncbi:MAG TPA: MBL fold metallo-hydrolase [Burkholderiaceae bacterium]|nr:MBL fold metallo-hydrolase [Burkholderiaceae bacterium]
MKVTSALRRRIHAATGIVAATAMLVVATVFGFANTARADEKLVRPTQIAPAVWFVQGHAALGSAANRNFISNAGFVVTGDGVVVVDGLGSPALAEELIGEVRRITPQPIKLVIVTHYHADHIYGLQAFKAAGARILAHVAAKEYLNSETAQLRLQASRTELAPWINESTHLVPADDWIDGDKTLRMGSYTFEIKHIGPSHTPEDLAVFVPEAQTLFAGDLVFRGRVPYVGQADSRKWIASLERVLALKARLLVPGHGPMSDKPAEDLQLTRDYLVYLRTKMGEAARNLESFEEVYAKTDWSRFEHLPLFRIANRMNAYNTYLLMEQQAEK